MTVFVNKKCSFYQNYSSSQRMIYVSWKLGENCKIKRISAMGGGNNRSDLQILRGFYLLAPPWSSQKLGLYTILKTVGNVIFGGEGVLLTFLTVKNLTTLTVNCWSISTLSLTLSIEWIHIFSLWKNCPCLHQDLIFLHSRNVKCWKSW